MTLAPGYTGNTCIGNFVKGKKDGKKREVLIYKVSDHKKCFEEVESLGISYTAGVPPVAAAILIATGEWDANKMVNLEELDPEPFIAILDRIGLPTEVKEIKPDSKHSFDGTVRVLEKELADSTAKVTVSAANPMIAFGQRKHAKSKQPKDKAESEKEKNQARRERNRRGLKVMHYMGKPAQSGLSCI